MQRPDPQDHTSCALPSIITLMRLILTHENADFDAVASLLAAHKLYPDATPLLPRRLNRNVEQFFALYWETFPFIRPSEWTRRKISNILLVDTHALNTVRGIVKEPTVHVIDHHPGHKQRHGWTYQVEAIGAATTLLVEQLKNKGHLLTSQEATLMLLGIYEDTGSLTYDTTTSRDILAAAWLLDQGALLPIVRRFLAMPLSEGQNHLYNQLITAVRWQEIHGQSIAITTATAPNDFKEEMSVVAHRLRETLNPTALFMLVQVRQDVQLIARSIDEKVDVAVIARALGGGGHSRAAAALVTDQTVTAVCQELVRLLPQAVQPIARVAELMSHGVQTVKPTTKVNEAARLMQILGYEGYPVYDPDAQQIIGLLTRRAIDRAMSHNLHDLPISRVMKSGSVTVRPSDSVDHLQYLMISEGWGQIPVLSDNNLDGAPIGIVTRTDLLNHLFQPSARPAEPEMNQLLTERLPTAVWQLVTHISQTAANLKLPLYFVGGIVRDLLLGQTPTDLDMVVEGDGIRLAQALHKEYGGDIHAHARFGTAKWMLDTAVWPDKNSDQLPASIDFVTARTEFYKEPSALPEIIHGSIKLDLHRRDFTINTLAIRLDGPFLGQLLDFYGGQHDLEHGLIRVLHSLSFVDDPTRILRAVRLEQRLGFQLETRTAELIGNALPLLARVSGARLRHEIELAFRESNPVLVMARLADLHILPHLHPGLSWTEEMAAAFTRLRPLLRDPIWQPAQLDDTPAFLYFALWLTPLPAEVQAQTMKRLRVRKTTRDDIETGSRLLATLQALPATASPSQIEKALRPYHLRMLLVARAWLTDGRLTANLDNYMQTWRHVKTAVTGNDLRAAGLKPGPQFAILLDHLLAARLDGTIQTHADEQALLAALIAAQQNTPPNQP